MALTPRQAQALLHQISRRTQNNYVMQAALHGIKIPPAQEAAGGTMPDFSESEEELLQAHAKRRAESMIQKAAAEGR